MSDPGLDFDLGEMGEAIRDTTRRFANDKIAPIAAEIDEKDEFPRHLWPQMGELGLHGITVEEEWGGLGVAQRHLNWWLNNHVYPVTFAWQSGPVESLLDHIADVDVLQEHLDRIDREVDTDPAGAISAAQITPCGMVNRPPIGEANP